MVKSDIKTTNKLPSSSKAILMSAHVVLGTQKSDALGAYHFHSQVEP